MVNEIYKVAIKFIIDELYSKCDLSEFSDPNKHTGVKYACNYLSYSDSTISIVFFKTHHRIDLTILENTIVIEDDRVEITDNTQIANNSNFFKIPLADPDSLHKAVNILVGLMQ